MHFNVYVDGKVKRISIDRLKPAFFIEDETDDHPNFQQKTTLPKSDIQTEDISPDKCLESKIALRMTKSGRHLRVHMTRINKQTDSLSLNGSSPKFGTDLQFWCKDHILEFIPPDSDTNIDRHTDRQ
ncbi:hypothetical protein AVEN_23874-1 [Araneus ventricosus]|uniref:Uncharacterized protein n=1 Tax=Araneus ventricosus TaxID=182803 RepID=A0A4Y2FH47_ARAVE|nr:hypothetical protein AVEN_23874-1 [Araneus ventricosus]